MLPRPAGSSNAKCCKTWEPTGGLTHERRARLRRPTGGVSKDFLTSPPRRESFLYQVPWPWLSRVAMGCREKKDRTEREDGGAPPATEVSPGRAWGFNVAEHRDGWSVLKPRAPHGDARRDTVPHPSETTRSLGGGALHLTTKQTALVWALIPRPCHLTGQVHPAK